MSDERLIHFYRLKQCAQLYGDDPTSDQIREALKKIAKTSSLNADNGIVRVKDETPKGSSDAHLCLWLSRYDRCSKEVNGVEASLNLQGNEKLLEKTYIVLYEDKYLACLYNYRGARIEQLAAFLSKHCGDSLGILKIEPRITASTADKFRSAKDITMMSFKIHKRIQPTDDEKKLNVIKKVQNALRAVDYDECEITLTGKNNKEEHFSSTAYKMLNNFIASDGMQSVLSSLQIRARYHNAKKKENMNFFKDRLVAKASGFMTNTDGTIKPESAYAKLFQAYDERRDILPLSTTFILDKGLTASVLPPTD
jgi:hypothetical protein